MQDSGPRTDDAARAAQDELQRKQQLIKSYARHDLSPTTGSAKTGLKGHDDLKYDNDFDGRPPHEPRTEPVYCKLLSALPKKPSN